MKIVPVAADGHCLYRSVAAQLAREEQREPSSGPTKTHLDIRKSQRVASFPLSASEAVLI